MMPDAPALLSRTVCIGTDVATLLLFHPDDLQHRADAPIAWYSVPFAYQPESAAGRLAAFGTGGDGGYIVRLTTGGLTGLEATKCGPVWDFPLQVRHGRVLLDNSDALPGLEQMEDPDDADTWFDLPNGAYRTTVHALHPGDDGDRAADGGAGDPALADLPDYVITFTAVPDLTAVPVASEPPWLVPGRDIPPLPETPSDPDAGLTWPAGSAGVGPHRLLPGPAARPPLPGQSVQVQCKPADVPEPFGETWLMAPVPIAGALAMLVEHTGQSSSPGSLVTITLSGSYLVRICALSGAPGGPTAETSPVPRPSPDADAASTSALRDALLRRADPAPPGLGFELDHLRSLRSGEAVTTWALRWLDLTGPDLLDIYAMPAAARIPVLLDWLDKGGRFRMVEA